MESGRLDTRALLEALGPITLATVASYFVGYSYYIGFLRTLSIPRRFNELSTTLYIIESYRSVGHIILLTALAGGLLATWGHHFSGRTETHLLNVLAAVPLVTILVQGLYLGFGLTVIIFTMYFLALIVYCSLSGHSAYRMLAESAMTVKLLIAFGYLFLLVIFSIEQGERDAIEIIEGREGARTIYIEMSPDPLALSGREFMLPMVYDDKYYLVEQQRPAVDDPIVYIVAEDQVIVANVRRVGDDLDRRIPIEAPQSSPDA